MEANENSPVEISCEPFRISDYCSNTTIHGVRYFTERRRHWTERCWWAIAIILSIWFCGTSIRVIWIKWENNPVTVIIDEEILPISTIPFPTITICSDVKTPKHKVDLTEVYQKHNYDFQTYNFSETELTRLRALVQICDYWPPLKYFPTGTFENASLYDTIIDMAPSLSETVYSSNWLNQFRYTEVHFAPVLTAEGLCFAFNAMNSFDMYTNNMASEMRITKNEQHISDWSPDDGYSERSNSDSYPRRVYSASKNAGLSAVIRSLKADVEYVCQADMTKGFKVFIHTPGTGLTSKDSFVQVGFSEAVEISFKPKLITTSIALRKYRPDQRQCFYTSERQLQFFNFYSQENCKAECIADFLLLRCECVPFFMPRNKTTRICSPSKIQCSRKYYTRLWGEDIIEGLSDEFAKEFRRNCNCLPACTTISYEVDVDRTKFNWDTAHELTPDSETALYEMSSVNIFFKHFELASFRREELYTTTDFLAICGGLLGLYLGVSALSVIEMFYYFSLRLFCSLRRWKSEKKVIPYDQTLKNTHTNHIAIDYVN